MRSKMPSTGHMVILWHRFLQTTPSLKIYDDEMQVELLGGYACGKTVIVVFRFPGNDDKSRDGLMRLMPKRHVVPVPEDAFALDVDSEDYDRFADLPVGSQFRLGGRLWLKLHPDDLATKMKGRLYAE